MPVSEILTLIATPALKYFVLFNFTTIVVDVPAVDTSLAISTASAVIEKDAP